jgi:hypothetical protein
MIFLRKGIAFSTRFDGIKGDDVNLPDGIFARFCLKTQIASVIAAPLAGVAVLAWVLFQAAIVLWDID